MEVSIQPYFCYSRELVVFQMLFHPQPVWPMVRDVGACSLTTSGGSQLSHHSFSAYRKYFPGQFVYQRNLKDCKKILNGGHHQGLLSCLALEDFLYSLLIKYAARPRFTCQDIRAAYKAKGKPKQIQSDHLPWQERTHQVARFWSHCHTISNFLYRFSTWHMILQAL